MSIALFLYVLAFVCFLVAAIADSWTHHTRIGWLGLALWVLVYVIDAAPSVSIK